jgi:hypothetical protein
MIEKTGGSPVWLKDFPAWAMQKLAPSARPEDPSLIWSLPDRVDLPFSNENTMLEKN